MPTDIEIKDEILKEIGTKPNINKVIDEINIFSSKEGLDGKPIIQKFYSQWKSSKKGNQNVHNSWMAYYLGMTSQEPIDEFSFQQRRVFARPSPPDIDSDFDYFFRDKIISYLVDKYGRGRVGNIGTYNALKMKSALTRVGKVLDIANAFQKGSTECTTQNVLKVREIIDSLPRQNGAILTVKDDDGEHAIKTTADAVKYCSDFAQHMSSHPEVMKYISDIEGLLSVFGCLSHDTPILTQKGWVRIDQLDKTCKIAYLNSQEKVKYSEKYISFKTGIKPCYRMKLENNDFIDVTDEHLIFTDVGCIKFEEIRKNPEKYKVYSVKE